MDNITEAPRNVVKIIYKILKPYEYDSGLGLSCKHFYYMFNSSVMRSTKLFDACELLDSGHVDLFEHALLTGKTNEPRSLAYIGFYPIVMKKETLEYISGMSNHKHVDIFWMGVKGIFKHNSDKGAYLCGRYYSGKELYETKHMVDLMADSRGKGYVFVKYRSLKGDIDAVMESLEATKNVFLPYVLLLALYNSPEWMSETIRNNPKYKDMCTHVKDYFDHHMKPYHKHILQFNLVTLQKFTGIACPGFGEDYSSPCVYVHLAMNNIAMLREMICTMVFPRSEVNDNIEGIYYFMKFRQDWRDIAKKIGISKLLNYESCYYSSNPELINNELYEFLMRNRH
jgi:hypothetical protein